MIRLYKVYLVPHIVSNNMMPQQNLRGTNMETQNITKDWHQFACMMACHTTASYLASSIYPHLRHNRLDVPSILAVSLSSGPHRPSIRHDLELEHLHRLGRERDEGKVCLCERDFLLLLVLAKESAKPIQLE